MPEPKKYFCPQCGNEKKVLVSHTAKNPNRLFAKCEKCGNFQWVDEIRNQQLPLRPITPPPSEFMEKTRKETEARRAALGEESNEIKVLVDDKWVLESELEWKKAIDTFAEKNKQAEWILENPKKIDGEVISSSGPLSFLKPAEGDALSFLNAVESQNVAIQKEVIDSDYQTRIYDFARKEEGNAIIEGVAGCGKTHTLVKCLLFTNPKSDVAFVAFNRHIAKELQERAPSHVHASTLHSLGYQNAREALGKSLNVNEFKLHDIWDTLDAFGSLNELKPSAIRLVNLLKATLQQPDKASIDYLVDHFGIELNGDGDKIYEFTEKLFNQSIANKDEIDYTDMIYLNAIGEFPLHQFDTLFIDELQDFSNMQLQMALKSVKPNGRVIGVGDSRQAIYSWAGAGIDSMNQARDFLKATSLPLSICYRCHKGAIRLAQQIVPQIEWRENAPEGIVKDVVGLNNMRAGDMILCRVNAPLVPYCFDLIRKGIKATIRGRDIGNGLVAMLMRGEKRAHSTNIAQVIQALSEYVRLEVSKLIKARKEVRASALQDQLETLIALAYGCRETGEVKRRIAQVFSDERAAITFSSVHRAKGLESERVFILKPELLPFPKAEKDWEKTAELNVKYVALTRAKAELYFVRE